MAFEKYKATPGDDGLASFQVETPESSFKADKPRVVAFLHPHCPCSRNSLVELSKLLAKYHDTVLLEIVLVKPEGVGKHWEETALAAKARSMSHADIYVDENGLLAKKLGATTSGHVILYDRSGHIVFSGGVTSGRGHEGDSVGGTAFTCALQGVKPHSVNNPVFGCPLAAKANDPTNSYSKQTTYNVGGS